MVSKIYLNFLLFFVYFIEAGPSRKTPDFDRKDYYLFHFAKDVDLETFSQELGFEYHEELDYLEDHHIFSIDKGLPDEVIKKKIHHYFGLEEDRNPKHGLNSDKIFCYEKQRLLEREKRNIIRYPIYSDEKHTLAVRDATQNTQQSDDIEQKPDDRKKKLNDIKEKLNITDTVFEKQWYLFNLESPGIDINATGLWLEGITGKNVTVGIVDDGVEHTHRELKDNYRPECSYDFIGLDNDPTPPSKWNRHGTRCAGEVVASKGYDCGVGVAFDAWFSGLRFIPSGKEPVWSEGRVLIYKLGDIDIYSCSWGPPDSGRYAEDINVPTYKAIIKGVNEGRNGRGALYVFGSGNGGFIDDCNYDSFASSPYTITIAAINASDAKFRYSESCSAILASTYSGAGKSPIYTTDVENKCTTMHTGTSASTPIASGIMALLISACPNLTWRDIQHLIVTTAVSFNPDHKSWEELPSGRRYSNYFGFGKLDAYALVQAARNFTHLNPQVRFSTPLVNVSKKFSESNGHITSTIYIHEGYTAHYGFKSLEYVGVSLNYTHQRRGHVRVNVTSPSGVTSMLTGIRSRDKFGGTYLWTFFSAKHWGESILGKWTLSVKDENDTALDGQVYDWQLHFFGESVTSTKTQAIEFPVTTRYPTSIPSPGSSPPSPPSKPVPSESTQTSSTSSVSSSSITTTSKTKTTQKPSATTKPSATSTEKPPDYSEGSQIAFFEKNALLISVFSVLFVFIIFGF